MAPTTSSRQGAKSSVRAKDALVGTAKSASTLTSAPSTSSLPHRKPLGQEGDSDDDDDEQLVFDDEEMGMQSFSQDDDDVMITDGPTLDGQGASTSKPAKKAAKNVSVDSGDVMSVDVSNKPSFKPLNKASAQSARDAVDVTRGQLRKVPIPPHRMTPLKNEWAKIYTPLVEMAGLQVRMNVKRKQVEIKSSKHTSDTTMLQKGADFVKAFALGFEADDAIAMLRIDDLFLESFAVKDVKTLHGDHLSRAIGRIAGKDGRTKFAIENASRTRLVIADTKIHILGSFTNNKIARDAVCALILGSPPGKVYNSMKLISARQRQRG